MIEIRKSRACIIAPEAHVTGFGQREAELRFARALEAIANRSDKVAVVPLHRGLIVDAQGNTARESQATADTSKGARVAARTPCRKWFTRPHSSRLVYQMCRMMPRLFSRSKGNSQRLSGRHLFRH